MGLSTAGSNRGGGKSGSRTPGFALFNYGGRENFTCQGSTFKMCLEKKTEIFARKVGNCP